MNRIGRIAQYLQEATSRFLVSDLSQTEYLETNEIAGALRLDRANVSKKLNELWNAGQAVKVQGRPTLYLSHRVLSGALPNRFVPTTLVGVDELRELLARSPAETAPLSPLEPPGVHTEAQIALENAQAVCSYPPYGLPVLLVSPAQEDAELFARSLFERIRKTRPAEAQLVTVDCRGCRYSEDTFLKRLFGCTRSAAPGSRAVKSSFDLSAHGMVYLEGIQRLPEHILEMLLTMVDRATYCQIGDTTPRRLETSLVLSLPPRSDPELLARLYKHIPYVQTITPLDERGAAEKLTLLLQTVSQEAVSVGRPLRMGKDVLAYLLTAGYPAGISELRTVVRLLFASVLRSSGDEGTGQLTALCRHLPQRVITQAEDRPAQLSRMLRMLSLVPNEYVFFLPDRPDNALSVFRNLFFRTGVPDAMPDEEMFFPGEDRLRSPAGYIRDCISFLRGCESSQVATLQKWVPYYILQGASRLLARSPQGRPLTAEPALALGLFILMQNVALQRRHLELPASSDLPCADGAAARLCRELFALFAPGGEFTLSSEEQNFFAAYIAAAGECAGRPRVALLLLLHGKGVVQEYLELLRRCDLPGLSAAGVGAEDEPLPVLTARAVETAMACHRGAGVLVVADLPPLLSVAQAITEQTGIPCRAVGGVSLPGLLSLAEQCAQGAELSALVPAELPAAQDGPFLSGWEDPFMRRYFQESFAPDLTFLNPVKAARMLTTALTGILDSLHLQNSHEITVKFMAHASHMLERAISSNTMSYPNLRRFLSENRALVTVVEHELEPVANAFGVTIPASELAYVAEIFSQYG